MKNKSGVSLITLIITIIVVIILAVIVLRSGASDAPDQAAFSKFTSQMGELQDAVKVAMLEAKADELIAGNSRSEAQLYNFIARGGYEGFKFEREKHKTTISDEAKWLLQNEAEQNRCTLINKECSQASIGMKLPVIKVETAKGVGEELSFFITKEGTVFCWPPYVYDGKSYVNANTTVKSDTKISWEKDIITDFGSAEMSETTATEEGQLIIAFSKNEYVIVENVDELSTRGYRALFIIDRQLFEDGTVRLYTYSAHSFDVMYSERYETKESGEPQWHEKIRGVSTGYDFSEYDNERTTPAPERD